jgi:hypothetical protein
MIRMEITEETPMAFVLEAFPQTFPLFQQIGVCCICDENMNSTIGEVCAADGTDVGAFIKALDASLRSE